MVVVVAVTRERRGHRKIGWRPTESPRLMAPSCPALALSYALRLALPPSRAFPRPWPPVAYLPTAAHAHPVRKDSSLEGGHAHGLRGR